MDGSGPDLDLQNKIQDPNSEIKDEIRIRPGFIGSKMLAF